MYCVKDQCLSPHGSVKASSLGVAQRDDKTFFLVCVCMFIVYIKNVHHSFLSLDIYSLKIIPKQKLPLLKLAKLASLFSYP